MPVVSFPDHGEATPTQWFDQLEAAIPQKIARLELPTFPDLSFEAQDFLLNGDSVASSNLRFFQIAIGSFQFQRKATSSFVAKSRLQALR
ncbi:MAG: hypothetical protein ABTR27_11475, partial [Candidatus Competibacter phosphatis]